MLHSLKRPSPQCSPSVCSVVIGIFQDTAHLLFLVAKEFPLWKHWRFLKMDGPQLIHVLGGALLASRAVGWNCLQLNGTALIVTHSCRHPDTLTVFCHNSHSVFEKEKQSRVFPVGDREWRVGVQGVQWLENSDVGACCTAILRRTKHARLSPLWSLRDSLAGIAVTASSSQSGPS